MWDSPKVLCPKPGMSQSPPGCTHVDVGELSEVVIRVTELDVGQLLLKRPRISEVRTQRRQLQTCLEGAAPA
ncbi:hypothetical protein JCGZ_22945 [Jatropha curcas]|uniref:Uncharacterized protein n=1 Tax=Jatropha curcas TaxID=180498 RepID=A0A067K114_JATCU|nr:hypothetical protein JCGZ_22945 [Jatropha curcas]